MTDANIIGAASYGPYDFLMWEFSEKKPGEERKLCFRVREKEYPSNEKPWESAEKSGYYHGRGIIDELIVLSSFFLRRRLRRGPVVRMDDKPMLSASSKTWIDKALVEKKSNFAELNDWLKAVEGLNKNAHQKFILSIRLYKEAILLIENQPDLAYLNLVSAIEVLCKEQDIEDVKLDILDRKLSRIVNKIEDDNLRSKIEIYILNRERFIGRRFVAFILDNIEESFWCDEGRPEEGQINIDELPELLKRIYNQRSKFLHDGEPFPPMVFSPPYKRAEMDISLSTTIGDRKWEREEYIPNPHFFERLVNHVLKTFLVKNQSK